MSKKTAGFEEFIIDDSMFMDTNTKGSNSKFLANDNAESIMLSVPRGSSEKSVAESVVVQPNKYKQPLFDTVSISDEEDLSSASSFQEEPFPEVSLSKAAAFPEERIDAAAPAAFPEVSLSKAAAFPEERIDAAAPVSISKAAAFPEEPIDAAAPVSISKAAAFPEVSVRESSLSERAMSTAAFPEVSISQTDFPVNETSNQIKKMDDFDGIKEEPLSCSNKVFMGLCQSENPDFDDVSVSTIQLEDYKPVSKNGGMIMNSTKILNFVPSPMEDLIENTDASANKSINFFLKMEKMDDHISINSVSVSKENDKPAELKETSISFDGKTGNLSVNKNGVVIEKVIETDSFTDFISKIYEPLMGRNNSISDSSLDSGEITDEEEAGQYPK
jgi:hypothetical protein